MKSVHRHMELAMILDRTTGHRCQRDGTTLATPVTALALMGLSDGSISLTSSGTQTYSGIPEIVVVNSNGVPLDQAVSITALMALTPDSINVGTVGDYIYNAANEAVVQLGDSDGTDRGATATPIYGINSNSFSVDSGDLRYDVAPSITLNDGTGFAGSSAIVAAELDSNGAVTRISVTSTGSAYSVTATPSITFTGGTLKTGSTGDAPTAAYQD